MVACSLKYLDATEFSLFFFLLSGGGVERMVYQSRDANATEREVTWLGECSMASSWTRWPSGLINSFNCIFFLVSDIQKMVQDERSHDSRLHWQKEEVTCGCFDCNLYFYISILPGPAVASKHWVFINSKTLPDFFIHYFSQKWRTLWWLLCSLCLSVPSPLWQQLHSEQ